MKHTLQEGLSLLEMLVSVAIIGIITIVLSQAFFATMRGSIKTDIQGDVKQSGDFSVRNLEGLIRSAESITSSCPAGGQSSKQLDIKNTDGSLFSIQCAVDTQNGITITRIASVSAGLGTQYLTPGTLTLGGTTCTDLLMTLNFTCKHPDGQPTSVEMSFTLTQAGAPASAFQKSGQSYKTTISMRN